MSLLILMKSTLYLLFLKMSAVTLAIDDVPAPAGPQRPITSSCVYLSWLC